MRVAVVQRGGIVAEQGPETAGDAERYRLSKPTSFEGQWY